MENPEIKQLFKENNDGDLYLIKEVNFTHMHYINIRNVDCE
jgi:hypothetical protein